jgi:uncharacterized protein
VKRGRWFLPESPDVHGLLRAQCAVTIEGADAFVAWAAGESGAVGALREIESRGDVAKRELLNQLQEAFVTPLEPEDVFALSRGIDWILDYIRDLVSEAEAMGCTADVGIAEMAGALAQAVRRIDEAIANLGVDAGRASAAADEAIKAERHLEHVYYDGMARLLEIDERNERIALRELYRACERIGETVVDVAERVIYAGVKLS